MATNKSKYIIPLTDFGNSASVAALSKDEQEAYEASLKVYRDNYAIATTERQIGFAEGQKTEKLETARRMKNTLKMDNSIIADVTGLTLEEIQNL